MNKTTTSRHKRWTNANGNIFPKDKYSFSTYLTDVGDFVRTFPLSYKDMKRIRDAAHFWAWQRGWKVTCPSFQKSDTTWEVEITLISKVYSRDFG